MVELTGLASTSLRGRLFIDEPMSRHVSWRAGGTADRLYIPADDGDLADFLRGIPDSEPLCFVGLGSNLLVRDGGFRGTMVLMHSPRAGIRAEGTLVFAGAGAACPKLARLAAMHQLEGAEFLAGIPGTVGGALAMNAGCYGAQTWEFVRSVNTIDRAGTIRKRTAADFDLGYRHVALRGAVVLGENEWFLDACFAFRPGDGARSRERIRELLARRIATQPLGLPNAGSVFRNPGGDFAARLIESSGLKGYAIGGARVSEKHANFIVNPGGRARAADIEALISHVRETVRVKTGVNLMPEVRIIGEAADRAAHGAAAEKEGRS